MKIQWIIIYIILIACILLCGCSSEAQALNLNPVLKGYRFSIANWQVQSLVAEIKSIIANENNSEDEIQTVLYYFQTKDSGLRETAEKIIEQQIREILREQNIRNPLYNLAGIDFPPVNFKLDTPPCLLVISPRDKIERIKDVLLIPDLPASDREKIESQIAEMDYSALVVDLGGMGATFPTFVNQNSGLQSVIDAAIEEWLHQYLTFTPLGFRYLLDLIGISSNYDVITINESLAGQVSSELGHLLYEKYYEEFFPQKTDTARVEQPATEDFNFNREMRSIRIQVDSLLSQGKIQEAEHYMEEKREYLETKGYYIRKLNQAYFAFYGSYADDPASISPVGDMLREIRASSSSLGEFLNKVSRVTSTEELNRLR